MVIEENVCRLTIGERRKKRLEAQRAAILHAGWKCNCLLRSAKTWKSTGPGAALRVQIRTPCSLACQAVRTAAEHIRIYYMQIEYSKVKDRLEKYNTVDISS